MTSRRRLRPRATRPTPLHWLSRTAFTALLLATVAVHASTQVQPGPDDDCALAHDPDLNDTLDSAVWPANAAAPLSDGYDLLFEKARREVRLEQRAEEESRRRQKQRKNDRRRRGGDAGDLDESDYASSTTGAASLEPANGVRVVRETFYIPRDQLGGSPEREEHSSVAPQESNAVGAGGSSSDPSPPADFRQTVGKLRILRPLFTYAIQHPLRFLLSYLISPLLSLTWFLLVELASWILLLFYPIAYLVSMFVLAPLYAFSSAVSALAPVLYALGGALAIGAGIGTLGGLVAAQSTRAAIDATLDRTQRTLRWFGILAKDEEGSRLDEDQGNDEAASRESYAGLSREADQLAAEAMAEAEAKDANDQQLKKKEELVVAVQKDDDREWHRAHAAAEARANRIEALRYRVKLEGAGPSHPTDTSMLVA
ncbi:hypothetical protein JCM8115_001935 [Rhodotorula mucilaginosa]